MAKISGIVCVLCDMAHITNDGEICIRCSVIILGVSKGGSRYPKYPYLKGPVSQYPNFKGPISQYPNLRTQFHFMKPISQICHWYPNIPISVSQYPKFRAKMSGIPISQFGFDTPNIDLDWFYSLSWFVYLFLRVPLRLLDWISFCCIDQQQ